jgi:tetratricopeptide (TPR) repeat protein
MAPADRTALRGKAQYLRFADEPEKARELLEKAGADELLWTHYVGLSRFEDAKRVLERLYERDPGDGNVLRGLLMVAAQTGDKEGVKRYSEELLSVDGSVDSRLLQIQTYLKAGLVKDAENSLERFKEQYRREGRVLLLEAWLAMRQGHLEKALELTNQNLQGDEENGLAWQIRGQINLLMGKQDQAIADFKKSKLLRDEPATRYYLARAYSQAGRVEDAITELENAIDYAENLSRGTSLGRGPRELLERIYLRLDRRAALGRFYDKTLQRFPDDAGWHNRAGAFAVRTGDFERAAQLYKRAMEAAGDQQEGKGTKVGRDQFSVSLDGYLQALVLGAGRPNAAGWNPAQLNRVFEEGRKYADGDFGAIAYSRMGEAKMKLGDKATATQYCRTALDKALGADESLASKILQRMYLLLGGQEVREYCEQVLVTDPDSLAANFALFSLMRVSAEYNKALRYIDKCLEVVGAEDRRRLSYVLSKVDVLSLAYLRTSDKSYLERAVGEYESLLTEMPNNTTVLNNLAYLLAENGERLPEALKHAARACELAPLYSLHCSCMNRGERRCRPKFTSIWAW